MKKQLKNKQTSIRPLWWVIGVLIVLGVIYLASQNKYSPEQQIGQSTSESRTMTYKGNGYEISYPSDWILDDSKQEAPAVIISSQNGKAKVYIQPQYDPILSSGSGKTALIKNLTDATKQNPDYTISSTEGTKVNGNMAYLMEGTFKNQGKEWDFREYTIFGEDGYFYTLRINNEPLQYQKALDVMVGSFKVTVPNQDEVKARSLVEKLTEVQNFKKLVEKAKRSTFGVRIDRTPTTEEPYYVAQVYEMFPDHKTTFNWYRVNPKTWIVERQDLVTDTWEKVK